MKLKKHKFNMQSTNLTSTATVYTKSVQIKLTQKNQANQEVIKNNRMVMLKERILSVHNAMQNF